MTSEKALPRFFCLQSPNASIAQGRYCPRKSLPKHFRHIVCMIKNHCHAISANVVGVGTNYWCINAHSSFRYFPKSEVHPLISKCFIGLFLFLSLFITFFQKINALEISSFSQLENFPRQFILICVRVAERLVLPTSDHGVADSNPAGGQILPESKRCFIAQSLSCSLFHRPDMTEILLKGT